MPVLTCDILLENVHRDLLFEELGNIDMHQEVLKKACTSLEKINDNELKLSIKGRFKSRTVGYLLSQKDDDHGGRRIRIETTGKRSQGRLSYSLRTMKPSRNTLITITWDYDPGTGLGLLLDPLSLRETYTVFIKSVLSSLVSYFKK